MTKKLNSLSLRPVLMAWYREQSEQVQATFTEQAREAINKAKL